MSTQLFLVQSRVSRTPYMGSRGADERELDLVEAANAQDAESKVVAHYEDQSDSYGVSVSCVVTQVKPALR